MVCPKCKKIISDSMNFCPYCGFQINVQATRKKCLEEIENVDRWIEEKNYKMLLEMASDGNMHAKYLYIRYIQKQSRTSMPDREEDYPRLKELASNRTPFAMTAYAISLYYEYREKGMIESLSEGIKTDKKKVAQAFELVNEAAEMGEAVAQFYLWNWKEEDGDDVRAYKLIAASAKQGYPPALYTLGIWHYEGTHGARKDIEKGYALIEKAAIHRYGEAVDFLKKEDKRWFDLNLCDALDEKLVKTAVQTLCVDDNADILKKSEARKEREDAEDREKSIINDILEKCTTFEDYVEAYRELEGIKFYIVDLSETKKNIKSKMESISHVSGNTIEEAIILKEQLDYCKQEMSSFRSIDDFAKFREWALSNNINKKVINMAVDYGNQLLARDYADDIRKYKEYKQKKPNSLLELICGSVVIFVITVIISCFFPIAMIIGLIIVFVGGIVPMFSERKVRKYKKIYQKMDQLDKQGYTLE